MIKKIALENFLVLAKKNTYADGESNSKSSSTRIGSKDYEFKSNGMTYHDTYFGGINFMGEEVVYNEKNIPIWGMNYYGITLDDSLSEEAVDMALRPALSRVGEDDIIPVRGPKEYINGEYKYIFNSQGDINNFTGVEEIYRNDELVYRLHCHGGKLK